MPDCGLISSITTSVLNDAAPETLETLRFLYPEAVDQAVDHLWLTDKGDGLAGCVTQM